MTDEIPAVSIESFLEELARGARTLSRRDPVLRPLIKEHGLPTFRPHMDYYTTLVDSIISQQISSRAAESIRRKLLDAFGGFFEPKTMLQAPDELLRGAGISPQKLGYLRSLAEHVTDGRLDLPNLPTLTDDEVAAELTAVKGIGIWTAQMFLIFSLGRLDVFPVGDLGVKRGLKIAYSLPEMPTPGQAEALAEEHRWSPYRSIVSWYMWRVS
ncbi:MAG: DNA-3-methyladenine glycosylase [Bacteroidota bacterium]